MFGTILLTILIIYVIGAVPAALLSYFSFYENNHTERLKTALTCGLLWFPIVLIVLYEFF